MWDIALFKNKRWTESIVPQSNGDTGSDLEWLQSTQIILFYILGMVKDIVLGLTIEFWDPVFSWQQKVSGKVYVWRAGTDSCEWMINAQRQLKGEIIDMLAG